MVVTAQLRDWVLENVDRGVPPGALARNLAQQGFDANAAAALVDTLWAARASGRPLPEAIDAQQLAQMRYRPQAPRIAGGCTIVAGDRRIHVALRIDRPIVAVLDDVLSPQECD